MTTSDDEKLKGSGLTRYVIRGRLGRGGSGVVYDAYDTVLERGVALKIIENTQGQEFVEKVRNEAVCAAKIQHPNIVPIYDFGVTKDGKLVYIAMEKLPGYPLREVLKAVQCLTVPEGIAIGLHLCAGLQAIHNLGIVHRDITPANIMLGPAMQVSLLDFGIAKFKRPRQDTTGKFVLQGTPLYVSPETCRGGSATPLSDLYAGGTVLHTLFLGVHFILRNNPSADYEDILRAHLTQDPEPLCELIPGFPRQLSNIIARAMAKDPAERWPSAFDMGEQLAGYERAFSEECRFQRLTPTLRDLVALTRAKNSTHGQATSLLERTTLRRLPDSIPNEDAPPQTHSLPNAFTRRALTPNAKPSVGDSDSALPIANDQLSRATIPRAPDARRRAGFFPSADTPDSQVQSPSRAPALLPEAIPTQAAGSVLTQSEAWFRASGSPERAGLLERLDAVPLRRFLQWAVVLSLVVSVPLGLLVGRSSAAKFADAGAAHLEFAKGPPNAESPMTPDPPFVGLPAAAGLAAGERVQIPASAAPAPIKPNIGLLTAALPTLQKAAPVKLSMPRKVTPQTIDRLGGDPFVGAGLAPPKLLPANNPPPRPKGLAVGDDAGTNAPAPSSRHRTSIY